MNEPSPTSSPSEDGTDFDVLIVGAGISGIGMAWNLQHSCPDQRYAILEAREDIGGTWDLFRYPGIRSDSDMYTFGFAFRPWSQGKVFADGPGIRSYLRDTADSFSIGKHIRFGHRVLSADFDTSRGSWTVSVSTAEGETVLTANFLVSCSGYYRYDRGYQPDFPGQEDFAGPIVHPQHWPDDLDYAGKRVVVIGSGATAVTLVPSLAEKAGHVTMLQRTPTYIAAMPSRDRVGLALQRVLPGHLGHRLARWKNIVRSIFFYELSQRSPGFVRKGVVKGARSILGPDFDVERHFLPEYRPWDQRFCLAPDGDFFHALAGGRASIVTDHIARLTPGGILLKSGEEIDADIIISATGLEMQLFGGATLRVDGITMVPSERVTYRGMMLSDIPNFAVAFGYTNASWTLKVDLTAERVCRMIRFMQRTGMNICTPRPPVDLETAPLLDFSSGYVQRALSGLPRQGTRPPWRTYQNYIQDMLTIRYGRLDDGHIRFSRAG